MESDGHAASSYVAENLRAIRGATGISQGAVAREMAARGWRWHQTTVGRIESGEQAVTLGEAVDLAEVLGVSFGRLVMAPGEAAEAMAAESAVERLRTYWASAVVATENLQAAISAAQEAVPAAAASRYPRVRELAAEISAALAECTLESVIGTPAQENP